MNTIPCTGSEALAHGALEAGVQLVTSYAGSPVTATVAALLRLSEGGVRIEWSINEKSAFDTAFGASLAGCRALVCVKSVGLNVALDGLMVGNLSPGDGGIVLLVGDDPGGWSSQNEEDSRPLAMAAELPLLEPCRAADAAGVMREAFDLSESLQIPVVVRMTAALAQAPTERPATYTQPPSRPPRFQRQPERFNVLPIQVVPMHRALQAKLAQVQARFEQTLTGAVEDAGRLGVIACGFLYDKLIQTLAQAPEPSLRVLPLSTLHPLPADGLAAFMRGVDEALVLEETAPLIETQVQALAQRAGLGLPIYGRASGHLPGAGEVSTAEIAGALAALIPGWTPPAFESDGRSMPSRTPLCDDCPYIPTFEALLEGMARHGGREAFVVTGETGCMVRAQLPPLEMLDVKYGMGSSIGLAAGLARAGIPQRPIALTGDSAFLHSGLLELIDAVQAGLPLLVVLLANGTTALSGGQPHPATARDAQGRPRPPVDLADLVRAAGVESVCTVDPMDRQALMAAYERGLQSDQLSVIIAERPCPRWEDRPAVE